MNSVILNNTCTHHSIDAMEIQEFACNCEALFYNLYIKTQEMVDSKKYLTGGSKELYNQNNSEIINLLTKISVKCNKLAVELNNQFEFLTTPLVQKVPIGTFEKTPKVSYVEMFY